MCFPEISSLHSSSRRQCQLLFYFSKRERFKWTENADVWRKNSTGMRRVPEDGKMMLQFWPHPWLTVRLWRTFYLRDSVSSPKNGVKMVKRTSVVSVCPRSIVPSSWVSFLNFPDGPSHSPQSGLCLDWRYSAPSGVPRLYSQELETWGETYWDRKFLVLIHSRSRENSN